MAETTPAPEGTTDSKDTRERSDIGFPYMGLEEAIDVARAIFATTGSGACPYDNLAAELGFSMNSSGFRVRLSTAKMFGLIDSERGASSARLTDLGSEIVDPSRERAAKVTAFLSVPLYRKLFDLHRGRTLPPPAALERVMAELGVAKKQTERARQTFDRSATSAGFFEAGRDKLIAPPVGRDPLRDEGPVVVDLPRGYQQGGAASLTLAQAFSDPLIKAMIEKLPPIGEEWNVSERIAWLQLMAMGFQLAYGIQPEIKISAGS